MACSRPCIFVCAVYGICTPCTVGAKLRAERVFLGLACSTEEALSSYFCTKAVCALPSGPVRAVVHCVLPRGQMNEYSESRILGTSLCLTGSGGAGQRDGGGVSAGRDREMTD